MILWKISLLFLIKCSGSFSDSVLDSVSLYTLCSVDVLVSFTNSFVVFNATVVFLRCLLINVVVLFIIGRFVDAFMCVDVSLCDSLELFFISLRINRAA